MIHKNLTSFLWGPKVTSQLPPQVDMAVCVRGVFRLAPGQPLEAIEDPIEQGFMSGDTFAEDDINQERELHHSNDFADYKVNAEVLLNGSCHAPGGSGNDCMVKFAVGSWSKTLRVFGPRVYKPGMLLGGSISEPQRFASMPLTWQNAYGGDGYSMNPVGRGFKGEQMHTVELLDSTAKKVGAKNVTPATFLPISPQWPQRLGKRGKKYGAKWQRTRAPFYAEDFDWTYFHAAPQDQQLEGFLHGDEELAFDNLHPKASHWTTKLPGLRIRAFVKTTDGKIVEPVMNLDTLYADIEGEKLYLTWRGLTPIQEIDMTDVGVVLIASEKLADEPRPAATYIQQLGEYEADPVGLKTAFAPGFLMVADAVEAAEQAELNGTPPPDLQAVAENLPPECPFPPWFLAAAAGDEDPLGIGKAIPAGVLAGDPALGHDEQIGGLADPGKQSELFAEVAKLAEDPSGAVKVLRIVAGLLPGAQQASFAEGLNALDTALEASSADLGESLFAVAAKQTPTPPAATNMAESYGEMAKTANDGLSTAADAADAADGASNAANVASAQDAVGATPPSLDAAVGDAMAPLDAIELPEIPEIPDTEADLAAKSAKLNVDEARMREKFGDLPILGMFAMGHNLIANAPRPADVAPDLSAIPSALKKTQETLLAQGVSAAAIAPLARLTAKVDKLVEQIPQPEPLPDGEFVAKNMRGHDFNGRDLQGENFCRSDLTGATFVGADLTDADFTKANLTTADLTGANLTAATFKGATMTTANLRQVTAHGATFSDAELGEVDGSGGDFHGAKFLQTRAVKSKWPKATLTNIDARFADLSKADLREANLCEANLSFATLNLVKGDQCKLEQAVLDLAKLTKCRLQGASLRGSKSSMGDFTGSNLSGADLSDCQYEQADFMKTVVDDANFSGAKLHRISWRDTIANRACFQRSDLANSSATGAAQFVDCDFRHSTGSHSVWLDAELTRSNFRHAVFLSAYFQGARGTDIDFTAAGMKHASFRKVAFTRTSFAYADLCGAVFQDASLDDADFKKSNCYDTKFLGAKAVRCRFEGAFAVGLQMNDANRQTPDGETHS